MKRILIIILCACLSAGFISCHHGERATEPENPGNVDDNKETGDEKPDGEAGAGNDVVILFTNDLHSQIEPIGKDATYNPDKGGVARIKVLVDSVRAAEKAVIVADAGDFVQGTYYFTCLGGDVEMMVQKEIGYDVRTIGNHEFDKKIPGLKHMLSLNEVTTVSSNYDFSRTVLSNEVKESAIIEAGGHKIGFIGLGVRLSGLVAPNACENVDYSLPLNKADKIAKELKANGAEMVIALSHLGYNSDVTFPYYDSGVAAQTENIDFIIGGHSHTFMMKEQYVENEAGNAVPIVQTGSKGIYLGYMKIHLDKVGKQRFSYRLIPVDSRLDSRIDPAFASKLAYYSEKLEQSMSEVLGYCTSTLRKGSPQGTLGNWATDSMVEMCEDVFGVTPDLAVCNNGGLRAEISNGDVTRSDIYAVFPFDNKMTLLELTGTSLLKFFDSMAVNTEPLSAGVRLVIKDGAVKSVSVGGKAIDPKAKYKICTIDYLVESGRHSLDENTSRQDSAEYIYDLFCDHVKKITARGGSLQADIDDRVTVL